MSRLIVTLAITALLVPVGAQARPARWSTGTAHTLPKGRLEVGLFQPLRYGATDSFELSTHPLLNAVMPNWAVKTSVFDAGEWSAAVSHGVHYPTPLLRLLSREGTGGVLPSDAKVPHIIGWNAELLATYNFSPEQMATGRFGVLLAARFGESDWPTLDIPIVFPRTAAYHNTATFVGGLDFDGQIVDGLWYLVDVDLFLMPWDQGLYALEHCLMINWRVTGGFALHLGYKMVFGEYPFGTQFQILPLLDLQLAWD
jgi:hypothetical protein